MDSSKFYKLHPVILSRTSETQPSGWFQKVACSFTVYLQAFILLSHTIAQFLIWKRISRLENGIYFTAYSLNEGTCSSFFTGPDRRMGLITPTVIISSRLTLLDIRLLKLYKFPLCASVEAVVDED